MAGSSSGPSRHGRLVVLLSCLLAAACASAGGSSGGAGRSDDVITSAEFGEPGDQTALTIVQRLEPGWLRPRSQGSINNPEPSYARVILDGMLLGDIYALDRVAATQIDRIEFLDALDATTQFGTGYDGGAIVVYTLRR